MREALLIATGVFTASRIAGWALLTWLRRDTDLNDVAEELVRRDGRPPSTLRGLVMSWDGMWYREIVTQGYPVPLPTVDGEVIKNAWAFYPGYPGTVRVLMGLGLSVEAAAVLLSTACGLAASVLFFRMIRQKTDAFTATLSVTALCFSPPALVLQVAYTEALALLLVLVCLWGLGRRRYWVCLGAAVALALTRPVVLPMAAVMGVVWLVRWRRRDVDPFPLRERVTLSVIALLTAASFLIWPAVVRWATGVPDAYQRTQLAWYKPGQDWETWLSAALTGNGSAAIVVGTFTAALGYVVFRRGARAWGVEMRSWAVVYPLFILAVSRITPSIVRYLLLTAVPAWPFPDVSARISSTRLRVLLLCGVASVGVGCQYWWAQWFFMIGPRTVGFP